MIVGLYGVSLCLLMPSVLCIDGFGELGELDGSSVGFFRRGSTIASFCERIRMFFIMDRCNLSLSQRSDLSVLAKNRYSYLNLDVLIYLYSYYLRAFLKLVLKLHHCYFKVI